MVAGGGAGQKPEEQLVKPEEHPVQPEERLSKPEESRQLPEQRHSEWAESSAQREESVSTAEENPPKLQELARQRGRQFPIGTDAGFNRSNGRRFCRAPVCGGAGSSIF